MDLRLSPLMILIGRLEMDAIDEARIDRYNIFINNK